MGAVFLNKEPGLVQHAAHRRQILLGVIAAAFVVAGAAFIAMATHSTSTVG